MEKCRFSIKKAIVLAAVAALGVHATSAGAFVNCSGGGSVITGKDYPNDRIRVIVQTRSIPKGKKLMVNVYTRKNSGAWYPAKTSWGDRYVYLTAMGKSSTFVAAQAGHNWYDVSCSAR
ncbi:MAG: hypothetical protein FWF12_02520 [Betaproteobacteria bacterium]|nr:hypothetical protein [Betaproteobacteria bacterium]